jgi:hypothetical protein
MSEALWKTWPVSTTKQVLGRQRDMEIAYLVSETGNYPPLVCRKKGKKLEGIAFKNPSGCLSLF